MDDATFSQLLTDDELVACAVATDEPWLGPLPTVDVNEEADLFLAARRGQRSLFVRGLIDESGAAAAPIVEMVRGLSGVTDCVSVLVADAQLYRASYDLSTVHYPVDGRWVVESVESVGIHSFGYTSNETNADYLEAVIESAMSFGPSGDGDPLEGGPQFVVLVARTAGREQILALRKGQIGFGTVAPDGGGDIVSLSSTTDVSTADLLTRLLAGQLDDAG